MCGIAGYLSAQGHLVDRRQLIDMARIMRHRGPDDEGFVLIDSNGGSSINLSGAESEERIQSRLRRVEDEDLNFPHDIALAHRRYSVIDLSPDGHQPMWDADSRACVSFYGEIYNYVELREELEKAGATFRTRSDTEVILQSYIAWGTDAFKRFNGPFAIALYDVRSRALLLCRDRIGKASFYYTEKDGRFFWATEIKAFLKIFGAGSFTVRDQAVYDFIHAGLRDFDGTFWAEINDFPPGCFARVKCDLTLEIESYWSLPNRRLSTRQIDAPEAIQEFRSLLLDATRIRCRADVPVAFELSGGMDSSALVALAAANISEKITTYTVKNQEAHSDEEPYAKLVQQHYQHKINYRVITPEKDDFWQQADEFVWNQEEPFHSPNLQTNQQQHKLMRKEGARVTITGAAGDEVLAGYVGDYFGPYLKYLLSKRDMLGLGREVFRNSEISPMSVIRIAAAKALLPEWASAIASRPKVESECSFNEVFSGRGMIERIRPSASFSDIMTQNMAEWKMNYWLRSGSKADFGTPIEARAPFLDPRIVDFCFRLPPEYLIRDGWHKWILRQAVKDLLPEAVLWRRKKMGFPFPIREWLMHSKNLVIANLAGVDCAYVAGGQLRDSYDDLAHGAPLLLWRLISLSLWWRKVIEGRQICGA